MNATILIPASEGWQPIPPGTTRRCRYGAGPHVKACGKPAVMQINRGVTHYSRSGPWRHFDSWWGYCADHLFGRVILDDGLYLPRPVDGSGWSGLIP